MRAAVERTADTAAADLGLGVGTTVVTQITRTTTVLQLDGPVTQDEYDALLAQIATDPRVAYVEPDTRVYPSVTLPNDPYPSTNELWGFWQGSTSGNGGFSTRAPAAWPTSTGNGVVVGVIDTGITAHPELDAQVVAGYDFVGLDFSSSGLHPYTANDGDGWDADPADPGDWITAAESSGSTDDSFFLGCDVGNSSWHGTHVAGTIGAIANNSSGLAGVAPDVQIQPIRALGKCGGYIADIAAAVRWGSGASVSGVPANATPADVLNLSLGGGGSCGTTMQSAINAAVANDTVVVVAAGNSNRDAAGYTPASCDNVITVAAHDSSGNRAWFSNYGSLVEISGPGVSVYSTLNTGSTAPASPSYAFYSGTSMATPHVAGVAALLMAADPTLTPAQVLANLQATAQPFAAGSSCIGLCGSGYVDAQASLAALGVQEPTALAATPDYESLSVSWTAPAYGATPTHYDIGLSGDSGATWSDDSTAGTTYGYSSLNPATNYLVRVRAATADDSSAWVTSAPTNPLAPTTPQAVTNLATVVDDSALDVSWTAPTDTGGTPILEYQVEHSLDDSTWIADDTTTNTSTTVSGLTNGTPYKVRITPVNAQGAGASATTDWATPRTPGAPSAPTAFAVTAGDGELDLAWAAPSDDGGRAVTGYTFQTSTDDSTWTDYGVYGGTAITIGSLTNGTSYSVRVAAINVIGTGAWATSSGTPTAPAPPPAPVAPPAPAPVPAPPPAPAIEPPGAPTVFAASADDRAVRVSWLPSDDTGGEIPTEFTAEIQGPTGADTATTTDFTAEFTGLTNGATYRIRVAATNSAGTGAFSDWSADLIPIGPASAPTGLTGEASSETATLRWTAPDDTGGSPILNYAVSWFADGEEVALVTGDTWMQVNGLNNGTRYDFRVAAQTDAGLGAWSAPLVLTPRADPATEPTSVSLDKRKRRIFVRWQEPVVGEPTRYIVSVSVNDKRFRAKKSTANTSVRFTISKRTKSVAVRVAAVDSYGRGPWSDPVELILKRRR